ncbi:hypothetical protein O0I10_009979 [Lichtheimia ornata]|uniref:Phospholipid-transporting ATPase n=1 Tax=Lichtheimia ornata TaxID=688661 RepID=A0AAD7XRT1_9FUNG|nr:uncharacterized protein O0I10_009979 [Lichtheimia ornata]KAJ8654409.1 hypothetical protein O0I10_009979 [Lichtheimia ornata]
MGKRLGLQALFRRKKQEIDDEEQEDAMRRLDSRSSYMQQRRRIYVNMELPASEYDDKGKRINNSIVSNRIRTAKYTPLTFIPKNLFEQFRNVANLYFLFLVILQCIPIFGVVQPAVSALPLIAILIITSIKDGFEDWKRTQSDSRVNNAKTLTLNSKWSNVNIPNENHGPFHFLHVILGFFHVMAGIDSSYSQAYRTSKRNRKNKKHSKPKKKKHPHHHHAHPYPQERRGTEDKLPLTELPAAHGIASSASSQHGPTEPHKAHMHPFSLRHGTIRTELGSIFRKNKGRHRQQHPFHHQRTDSASTRHSVLYRVRTQESTAPVPSLRRSSTVHPPSLPRDKKNERPPLEGKLAANGDVRWKTTQWKDLNVGDYIMMRSSDDVPADVVILATSDDDNICYIETQNLDGETNLKVKNALSATKDIASVEDCQNAEFYIESEPPHVNLYAYSGVMKWQIDAEEAEDGIPYEKTEPITYSNLLLRGCVVRNTDWVIGVVVFTGRDTKIMLNSGQTPSKRSKMAKATNPLAIANFVILAIICIISSIFDSVQYHSAGSMRFFDFNISGDSAAYNGFLTFWVTLILYQNIVPISLYISVEIVKTLGAYFIHADIDMYHAPTDTPCIAKTWNISDDLGQIEYIFSDKTGTLTQNVMEYRKCTINSIKYGLGMTEASMGAKLRETAEKRQSMRSLGQSIPLDLEDAATTIKGEEDPMQVLEAAKKEMYDKQALLFENKHVGANPTFIDPKLYDHLGQDGAQAASIMHFFMSLALCHTVVAERPDEENPDQIEYRAQSPDEAALVAAARDVGFVYLGREGNTLNVQVRGEPMSFELLNVLEFNSTRKRMSVILRPHDSNKIILLCKGADSIIYERLCTDFGNQAELEAAQTELRTTTSSHLEDFANEGLRTLCLSYRFISEEEYAAWNQRYQEASASLYDREQKIDDVAEQIECNMLLMGGTAIEDRLQDGVPETIAELAKSGIKLWVLTGDKTETAINIGFACNLLTTDMELVIVKAQTREDTAAELRSALDRTDPQTSPSDIKRALVIDGTTLKYGLEPKNKAMVLELGMRCTSVLCCRVSPKQKAEVVRLVKKGLKVMTLAIGDGANDVSMIQEANVGIGISGLEGRQAVMASDYAIAQFRFLHKLLLVHGRWSYLRTSEMIMGFFYKNIVWTFVLFWYQIFCQFTGSMMFEYSLVTLYNLIFTSLPIIFLGIWDQDLDAKTSLRYPELYRMGLRNDVFTTPRFWLTVFDSIYQSVVCFFFPYMLLVAGNIDQNGYLANGIYEIGTVVSSIVVFVVNFFVAVSLYSFTWIQIGIISLSILVYYAFVGIYAQFNTFVFAGHVRMFGSGYYWLVFILTVVACFVPRYAALHVLNQYRPYDNAIIREKELVLSNTRSLDASEKGHPPSSSSRTITDEGPFEDIKMEEQR